MQILLSNDAQRKLLASRVYTTSGFIAYGVLLPSVCLCTAGHRNVLLRFPLCLQMQGVVTYSTRRTVCYRGQDSCRGANLALWRCMQLLQKSCSARTCINYGRGRKYVARGRWQDGCATLSNADALHSLGFCVSVVYFYYLCSSGQ